MLKQHSRILSKVNGGLTTAVILENQVSKIEKEPEREDVQIASVLKE